MKIKTSLQGKITLTDSGGLSGSNKIQLVDNGDFALTLPTAGRDLGNDGLVRFCEVVDMMIRGRFEESRTGKQVPITAKFSLPLRNFTGGIDDETATLLDLARYRPDRGHWVDGWVPDNGTDAEIPHWRLYWAMEGSGLGDGKDHQVELRQVELTVSSLSEAIESNKIDVSIRAWSMQEPT